MSMKVLRRPEVEARVGFKRTAIYSMTAKGEFPKPILLGKRAVGWLETDVNEWIKRRVKESRGAK